MRFKLLMLPIALLPFLAYGETQINEHMEGFSKSDAEHQVLYQSFSNESEIATPLLASERTMDYPTQIIRTKGSLAGQNLKCRAVISQIESFFLKEIPKDKYFYDTLIYCKYNATTALAVEYGIESYFDPKTDLAVEHLKGFLAQYNDSDLLGTALHIEAANGVIVAMNIAAGMKKNPDAPPFIEYRQDRNNFFFKNNYEVRSTLFADIFANFFSNDPDKILPFLDKWIFNSAGNVYQSILSDSNYVELQPERIFLMGEGEHIFVSHLKLYFNHHCERYQNHRCL